MGVVYLARDAKLDRDVAIKALQDGRRFLILEFVEGTTLADRLEAGPVPADEALELADEIAAGVEAAHEAGVIHRDLKPDNIKIAPQGSVKVLDFGLAKADEAGLGLRGCGDGHDPSQSDPSGRDPRHRALHEP
jgi:serine/threonine-protein kinase